ncbi:MAG: hypothetical protein L6U99_02720 [Clostridium sp.]|nr:MAG: hypothetical protein L6U99_02720 [Clostridium sp.]
MHTEDLISIYPSTTAAATTAAISGLAPLESGWTGWQNYVKEINQKYYFCLQELIILLTNKLI